MSKNSTIPPIILHNSEFVPLTYFPVGKKKLVFEKCQVLKMEGNQKLKIGIDYSTGISERRIDWFKWVFQTCSQELEIEPVFVRFSEVSLKEKPRLADSIETFIYCCGEFFDTIGLWRGEYERIISNEVLNVFSSELEFAISWTKHLGKKVDLGGICLEDFNWIIQLIPCQILRNVDVITLDPSYPFSCQQNRYFHKALCSLFEAKGLEIKIHIGALDNSFLSPQFPGKKIETFDHKRINSSLKITG